MTDERPFDVICVGSATLDIFVKSPEFKVIPSSQSETGVVLCETYGAKIEVNELQMLSGGGATNAAVSFARKGFKAGVICEIGKDLQAGAVLADLQYEHVDTTFVVQEQEEHTAMSVVLVSEEGGRSIVTYRGASKMLEVTDIPWERLNCRWMYISSLGGRVDLLEALIHHAKEKNILVAVNPGGGELLHGERLRDAWNLTEVLILNMEELCELLHLPYDQQEEALKQAETLGARHVVITAGKQGAYVMTEGKKYFCPSVVEHPKETTGAGDAFGSGFVCGLALGWPVIRSMQLAAANAASVVQHVGAKKGLLRLEEFDQWSHKPTVHEQ